MSDSADSSSEFLAAMADVTPLKASKISAAAKQPKKPRSKRLSKPINSQPGLVINPDDLYSTQAVSSQQKLSFIRQGFANPKELSRFQRGEMPFDARLDLHGYTLDAANQKLLQFMQSAQRNQRKHLLIIHGKGYNSDTDFPAIKNLVNQTLQQLPLVQAFVSAQPKHGGTGAVYVWLANAK